VRGPARHTARSARSAKLAPRARSAWVAQHHIPNMAGT
jgi:hypothetical protein